MILLEHLLQHPFIRPLGWSLLHFLWQGTVVAMLLAALLRLLHTRTAQARYLAACAALLILALCPVLTLLALQSQPDRASVPSVAVSTASPARFRNQLHPLPSVVIEEVHSAPLSGLAGQGTAARAVERSLPGLVAAWLLGVLVLLLRLLGGWIHVRRLSRLQTRPLTGWLQARTEELARQMGITRPLLLLESAIVQVPTVVGWLHILILVPVSALSGLTPQMLESLLAHELAHVRRYDYLVNLIQILLETLLFYHPATWWVSQQIRLEREHCCDDLAVQVIGDRVGYARALASLEELRAVPSQLALAGSGGDLLARVRRLLGLPSSRTSPTPASIALTITAAVVTIGVAALRLNGVLLENGDRAQEPAHPAATAWRAPLARSAAAQPLPRPTPQPLMAMASAPPGPHSARIFHAIWQVRRVTPSSRVQPAVYERNQDFSSPFLLPSSAFLLAFQSRGEREGIPLQAASHNSPRRLLTAQKQVVHSAPKAQAAPEPVPVQKTQPGPTWLRETAMSLLATEAPTSASGPRLAGYDSIEVKRAGAALSSNTSETPAQEEPSWNNKTSEEPETNGEPAEPQAAPEESGPDAADNEPAEPPAAESPAENAEEPDVKSAEPAETEPCPQAEAPEESEEPEEPADPADLEDRIAALRAQIRQISSRLDESDLTAEQTLRLAVRLYRLGAEMQRVVLQRLTAEARRIEAKSQRATQPALLERPAKAPERKPSC
ncbi:MAG TPA: M56 family metallopeptidase [Chthonomonadaceae bacterium]|nr:M56 family metallopeptidase [Chthonomonadaceae bacterium]